MTLTTAFAYSRNIPALKLADKVGIKTVIATARRFGITSDLPPFLPVAIGAASITLAEQTAAYTVFPNDGIRIAPHYIRRVTQADGVPLDAPSPPVSEVISVDTAREMMTMLRAVTTYGTASVASSLGHQFGGKTGTTNDYTDAWFVGFSPSVTAGVWIGFDSRESLGPKETGAKAALPIWMSFMKVAIEGKDGETFPSAGAPKKHLDVTPGNDTSDEHTPTKDEEMDVDGAEPGSPKPAASAPNPSSPASPAPATPVVPQVPAGSPAAPAPPPPPTSAPPSGTPQTGVSKPPPA